MKPYQNFEETVPFNQKDREQMFSNNKLSFFEQIQYLRENKV